MAYGYTELNSGTGGSKVAGDFVSEGGQTKEFQRIKVVWGPEGTITPLDTGVGAMPSQGADAHDAPVTGSPVLHGGRASAAAPSDVSADGDAVRAWYLRSGAAAVVLTAAGALLGGDASNGLDVDVTRVQGTVTIQGGAATDAAVTGNPLLSGARASTAAPTPVSADGDAVPLRATRGGELMVTIVDAAGDSVMDGTNDAIRVNVVAGSGGGVSATDDAAFTPGSGSVVPIAGIYRTSRDSVDDNDTGALAMNQRRGLYVSLETPNSDSLVDDTSDAVKMIGPIAHDAANAGNHNPLLVGWRAANSVLAAVSADGDAAIARSDRFGQLFVRLADAAGDSMADEANDSLRVSIVNGGGSGGTAMTDDAAFTPGSTQVTPMAGTYRTVRDTLDDNDAGAVALTQRRAQYITVETPSGDSAMDETNDAVRVSVVTGTVLVSPNEVQSNSNITANGQTVTSQTGGYGGATFEITGTWVGTLEFEGRAISGWQAVLAYPSGSTAAPVTNTTANGIWQVDSAGFDQIRFRSSAWTSGTATCLIVRTTADAARPFVGARIETALPAGTNNIGDVDVITMPGVGGVDAHDAAVSANPVLVGARASAAAPSDVSADGDAVRLWALRSGALATVLTAAGALIGGDATNGLDVDVTRVSGNVTVVGTAASDAAVSGNPVLIAGRASAAAPTDVSADGDVVTEWRLRNGAGAVVVTAAGALIGGDATNGLDVDVTRVSGNVTVVGAAAHDAAVSGNPVLVGLEARTSDGTAVTSGDAVRGLADTLGKQVVLVGAVHDLHVRGTANYTNTTASDLVAAAGAGVRIAVMGAIVTNAHATVSTKVELRDGTTVKVQGYAAAAGGGFVAGGTVPLFITTANTAATGRCVTTGSDVDITIWGYKIGN